MAAIPFEGYNGYARESQKTSIAQIRKFVEFSGNFEAGSSESPWINESPLQRKNICQTSSHLLDYVAAMVEKSSIHRFIALCRYAADSGLFCTILRIISYTPTAHLQNIYVKSSPKISSSKVFGPSKSVTRSIIRCLSRIQFDLKRRTLMVLLCIFIYLIILTHDILFLYAMANIRYSNIFTKYRFPSQSFSPLKRIPISASALVKARLFCWSRRALKKISSNWKQRLIWKPQATFCFVKKMRIRLSRKHEQLQFDKGLLMIMLSSPKCTNKQMGTRRMLLKFPNHNMGSCYFEDMNQEETHTSA